MFADVILPLPLSDLYTYSVPVEMQGKVDIGKRVIVPFGKKKYYTAIVKNIHSKAPVGFKTKEIHSLVDPYPVVNEDQLKLWEWISFYYICPLSEVYKAAMPGSMKSEDFKQGFKPKTETFLQINPKLQNKEIPDIIGRAKKQLSLFNELYEVLDKKSKKTISKKEITNFNNYSSSAFKGLTDKNILEQFTIETSRLDHNIRATRLPYPLSQNQQNAFNEINESFKSKDTCLLYGVTSSGKTEIYIHLIKQYLKEGKQILYLVPEIALTTGLAKRLQSVFGNKLGIYHSKVNDNERTEIWQKMLSDKPFDIILGARSSLFLPYQKPGLLIVDEEHETSYKQQDPAPRYNARDTAIMLAHIFGAKTLLGSATPSLESFYNAQTGKYGLVKLMERYNNLSIPLIQLENTYELIKRKKMKTILSPTLYECMRQALESGEQVVLFRNRRGYASVIECKECSWTLKCKRCDVSLTFHKHKKRLVCHYCNTDYPIPDSCPSCGSKNFKTLGCGTEQIEQDIADIFPDYTVARVDADTTRSKYDQDRIFNDFQENRIQILVGTQMLSKGLDFDNVGVVGVISADSLFNYPDFRSHERGFHLILQTAGRAGRREKQGRVIIQSANPEQPVYNYLINYDYEGFYESQLSERSLFKYPPCNRLIKVVLRHRNAELAEKASYNMANILKSSLSERVLGPNVGVVSRIKSYYINEILLKLENNMHLKKVRDTIIKAEKKVLSIRELKYVQIHYDVDPL